MAGAETTRAPDAPAKKGRGRAIRRLLLSLPFLLLLLALTFVALGVVFQVKHHGSSGDTSNQALVNAADTSTVVGQVNTALTEVLSYDYKNPTPTQQAAAQALVGVASKQYDALFSALRAKAPGQQLTLKATVTETGVVELQGDKAQLLVFLNQTSTRASDNMSNLATAQLLISAVRSGGSWKISGLQTLGS